MTGPSLTMSTAMWAPKLPVSTRCPRCAEGGHEHVVELGGAVGRSGSDERGAMPSRGVGVEGELAHHEDRAAGGRQIEIHPSGRVWKDPEGRDARGEPPRDRLIVGWADGQQDAEPCIDGTDGLRAHGHPGAADPLDDRPHSRKRSPRHIRIASASASRKLGRESRMPCTRKLQDRRSPSAPSMRAEGAAERPWWVHLDPVAVAHPLEDRPADQDRLEGSLIGQPAVDEVDDAQLGDRVVRVANARPGTRSVRRGRGARRRGRARRSRRRRHG